MRSLVLSLLLAALALAMIPVVVAEAGYRHAPHGWGRSVHYDRHAYRWEPRGYYPYYNSRHWAPVEALRYRRDCCRPPPELPPYYQAWGHPHRYYHHKKWHRRHFGRHRHHHW